MVAEIQPAELQKPEIRAVTASVDELEEYVRDYTVTTVDEYEAGAEDLKRVKAAQQKLEDARTSITGPMNAALKAVNNFFRKPAERLASIETTVKRELAKFATAQEARQREEQRQADAAARKERERLEAQAQRATESGRVEKAAALEHRAATVVAPVINRAPPKVTGVRMTEVWKFEVTDPALVPREYLSVDESKIRKVVSALKAGANIPGVRVYPDKQVAAGAA